MSVVSSGQAESGLDRALELALAAELDDVLETGLLWPEELQQFPPEPLLRLEPHRAWQRPIQERRDPPGSREPLRQVVWDSLKAFLGRLSSVLRNRARDEARRGENEEGGGETSALTPEEKRIAEEDAAAAAAAWERQSEARKSDREVYTKGRMLPRKHAPTFRFVEGRIGIVVIHGIGPQLAGQTLLDWTRPIITALTDWRAGHQAQLKDVPPVADPVVKANIDFSGETFPVLHVQVPGIKGHPDDPRTRDQRWVFTEAWWAAEVRPPTLPTMIGWLGEQGGVGRIVQGIQENQLGKGWLGQVAKLSLGAFVSVIVSFVLLLFVALLGISKLIPFGPLRNAVGLRLAASFLTDWFGGARTLLRDPAQSANVRTRLVTTIKALRAYGCRDIVIVAHSGGTMVSYTSLTDPAFPRLRVQKLITIGEALNLGWRLEDQNPDQPPPTPATGNRMRADLAKKQPQLQWRDFWATHDPAPSGPPQFPDGVTDPNWDPDEPDPRRFTAERVYNRMNIGEDHGGYWDNDEHFVIPLIRELDVPRGDRTDSRFYSDVDESRLRARRKERVSLLVLLRRVTLALPVLAILAAATVTSPGIVPEAGDAGLAALGMLPGQDFLVSAGQALASNGSYQPFLGLPTWVPAVIREAPVWVYLYDFGLLVLRVLFVLAVVQAVVPARIDRLWGERGLRRLALLAADLIVGVGLAAVIGFAWLRTSLDAWSAQPEGLVTAIRTGLIDSGIIWAGVALIVVVVSSWAGRHVRKWLRQFEDSDDGRERFLRGLLIVLSSAVLATVLLLVVLTVVGFVVVFAGNNAIPSSDATRRFIVGALLILVLFQAIQRVGVWRWLSWDIRERRALRRNPQAKPYRNWVRFQAILLWALAIIGAILVALGSPGADGLIGDRGPWLFAFFAVLLFAIVVSIGKDVVDSDIDTLDKDSAAVMPEHVGKAAGSS
jgi:hypothetical protein